MVWRISSKQKQPSKEEIQSTAMIGLAVIIGLGIIAWAVQHLQYIGQNMSNKTFKEFAEACWVGYKKVGMKKSSRTGKQVPNCVPEDNNLTEAIPHIVVDKDNSVLYRGTKDNALKYQVKKYSTHPNLKVYAGSKLKAGDTYKFRYGHNPIDNPGLAGAGKAKTKLGTIKHYMQTKASYNAEDKEVNEVSAAMRALRRRNAKNARTQKTIAKYGQAAKMGIPASQVNQRRTAVTRKKI